ncbi:MAG: hypothetical protein FWC50_14050 [Planctomycetaceae bacterium]|nr:hypothetical protein [Planctomycetaceae bacterium]
MNQLGKILVGVLCVMSIILMAFAIVAFSTQHNWKTAYQNLDKEREKIKGLNDQREREKTDLERQKKELEDTLREETGKLSAKNADLEKENTQLKGDMDSFKATSDNNVKLAAATQQNLKDLYTEVTKLRGELSSAQMERQAIFTDLVTANDRAQSLALELATLAKTNQTLAKDYANARQLLDKLNYTLDPTAYTDIPPRVQGTITEIRPTGLVELSIGSDDGILQGHRLHVYRENDGVASYLGAIDIVSTEPSKAVGRIIPELRNGTILRGDHVASKIQ